MTQDQFMGFDFICAQPFGNSIFEESCLLIIIYLLNARMVRQG